MLADLGGYRPQDHRFRPRRPHRSTPDHPSRFGYREPLRTTFLSAERFLYGENLASRKPCDGRQWRHLHGMTWRRGVAVHVAAWERIVRAAAPVACR